MSTKQYARMDGSPGTLAHTFLCPLDGPHSDAESAALADVERLIDQRDAQAATISELTEVVAAFVAGMQLRPQGYFQSTVSSEIGSKARKLARAKEATK